MTLIIFDFDGVIADSLHYIRLVLNSLADKYGFRKIDSDEHYADLINGNVLEVVKKLRIKKLQLPMVFLDYKRLMKKEIEKVRIYRGMEQVLKRLSEEHELAIVSSNHKDVIEKVLEHNNLSGIFDQILGLEFSFHKSEKLRHLTKKKSDCVFITDTVGDVRDAKEVKIKTIGVAWGYHSWSEDDDIKPEIIVRKPKELMDMFV